MSSMCQVSATATATAKVTKSLLDAAEDFSAAHCMSLGESSLTDCLTSTASSHLHLAENVCMSVCTQHTV